MMVFIDDFECISKVSISTSKSQVDGEFLSPQNRLLTRYFLLSNGFEVEGVGSKGVNILTFERVILGYETGGVFYYQLKTELFVASKKMLLMN